MPVDPVRYVAPLYRPPSESDSLILPVTDGCSWNRCTFCEMYTAPQKRFRPRAEEEVLESIRRCGDARPREFHPEPPTDPDLILSHHPARAIA